jgi:DNA-binding response OmpR family regulator
MSLAAGRPKTAGVSESILVIEDELAIVDFLERGLRAEGFVVDAATDGIEGTRRALLDNVDLVVLDMMLPGRSGAELLMTLREARPTLPVIVLTARGELEDRVAGLNAGAVDYLVKPFAMAELVARIRAQLRVASQAPTTTARCGDIELELMTREVRRGEVRIHLSTTEFELLAYFVRNR